MEKRIYRRKMYKVAPSILDDFNEHFNKTLLPTQLKYGARLVGRWMTKEINGVIDIFAIWEYDSYEDYEIIENKVKSDEEHVKRVQKWYQKMAEEFNKTISSSVYILNKNSVLEFMWTLEMKVKK